MGVRYFFRPFYSDGYNLATIFPVKPKYGQKFGCLGCFMNKEYPRRMGERGYSVDDCGTYDMMTEEERGKAQESA